MTIVKATKLTLHDLSLLGWEAKRTHQRDRLDFSLWRGWRTAIGYECAIPCTVRHPVIRAAVDEVLSRIARLFFNDALVLEAKVDSIDAIAVRRSQWRDRRGNEKTYLGRWLPDEGKILLNLDLVDEDFRLACFVFAHECGHAVQRIGHDWGHTAKERLADQFANNLGYKRPRCIAR